MSTSGNWVRCCAFFLAEVSPVRSPTSQDRPMPSAMRSAAEAMSADKARNGATQSNFSPF